MAKEQGPCNILWISYLMYAEQVAVATCPHSFAVEELQMLWEEQDPDSISVSLENGKVCAVIYHPEEDGYHLRKTELNLESGTLRQLLQKTVEDGIYMDEDGIDFQCAGAGFGTNTAYSGIFNTETEKTTKLPFFLQGLEKLSNGDSFSSSAEGDDNEIEIQRAEAGFLYYRRRY